VAVCVAVGAGECFYTATLMPLTAELAPEGLRGRYMAALGFSWWAGAALLLGAEVRNDLLRVHGAQWCPNQARAGGRSRRSKISG
jgi:MFS family permease